MITKIEKYGASWCGPCRTLDKTLDELCKKHPNLTVERFDVDEMEESELNDLNIKNVPVLIFVDENGKEYNRLIGAQSLTRIEDELS